MSNRIPLVIAAGAMQQLQPQDDLDIPLEERFQELKRRFNLLILVLAEIGLNLPEFNVELTAASQERQR